MDRNTGDSGDRLRRRRSWAERLGTVAVVAAVALLAGFIGGKVGAGASASSAAPPSTTAQAVDQSQLASTVEQAILRDLHMQCETTHISGTQYGDGRDVVVGISPDGSPIMGALTTTCQLSR